MNTISKPINGFKKRGEAEITLDDFRKEVVNLTALSPQTPQAHFPVDVFPDVVQSFIQEFVKAYKLPSEYYGVSILSACAGIIGNSFLLKYQTGFFVPGTLYAAIIGYSSSGKTPVLKSCLSPLYQIESEMNRAYLSKISEWESECASLTKGQPKPPKPVRREIIINDATIESINCILLNNPNGLILIMDELLGWVNGMNQYRKGADEQFWLSNWSNNPIKVSRASKETLFVPRPNISVIGGLQPGILKKLASGDKRDNGFIFRILFAFPTDLDRPMDTDYEPHETVIANYNKFIQKLFELVEFVIAGLDKSSTCFLAILSDEARSIYKAWQRELIRAGNESGCESTIAIYGKMEQYCLRFALILGVLDEVEEPKLDFKKPLIIGGDTIEKALCLTKYFIKNSFRVLNIIDETDPLSELNEIKQKTYLTLKDKFKTGEGVIIAEKCGMSERNFKRFIQDKVLFKNLSRGYFEKNI